MGIMIISIDKMMLNNKIVALKRGKNDSISQLSISRNYFSTLVKHFSAVFSFVRCHCTYIYIDA